MRTECSAHFVVMDAKSDSMDKPFSIIVNGQDVSVRQGMSVAAAILSARQFSRRSMNGAPRAPLCGMGVCMECRATVNGTPHVRTCQLLCAECMEIEAQ